MSTMSETKGDDAEEVESWNTEDALELERPPDLAAYDIVVAARDWTVETMVQQIRQGNIDLDPAFQRRNAWRDARRSRLIESFILGFPVPQIVLAENPRKKKSYVVIDGKQRLMTIAGFYLPEFRDYWTLPRFTGLEILSKMNRMDIDKFLIQEEFAQLRLQLSNADIRTTVLSGFREEGVLYDIFYRINTGSVPLSSQELRQVLNRGDFAKYLLEVTSTENELWKLLNITSPDARLRDVELLLRLIAWIQFSRIYQGNMKLFLDDTMKNLNDDWKKQRTHISAIANEVFLAVGAVREIFGEHAGRKFKNGRFERRLNRALFEVQAFFFISPSIRERAVPRKKSLVLAFKNLSKDAAFLSSIESTTKSIENTSTRFESYRRLLQRVLKVKIASPELGGENE